MKSSPFLFTLHLCSRTDVAVGVVREMRHLMLSRISDLRSVLWLDIVDGDVFFVRYVNRRCHNVEMGATHLAMAMLLQPQAKQPVWGHLVDTAN